MRARFMIAAIVIAIFVGGCVETRNPSSEQRWYEYSACWGVDGEKKPWFYYPVFVPIEVILGVYYWISAK